MIVLNIFIHILNLFLHTLAGHISAACVSLQERLNRSLLWLARRHHVGEIMLAHVWEDLGVEVSKGPEVSIFRYRISTRKPVGDRTSGRNNL